ncbi:hypothetical protein [Tahibacter amnicola]|uniref:Uncharacterized protein n=1 Tax=Tahibacter amnicola TaxID=2976241 RepID=A0ABY6BQP7_9GAMM|nr:hypothetical protein [Tahibacter amnicola]UXI70092.1 hypothetical protein N4264_10825 [Tahibacter amnicola]
MSVHAIRLVHACLLWAGLALPAIAGEADGTCTQNCPAPYVPNTFWTTEYGPAAADVVLSPTNFLSCPAGPYALCFYSGPDTPPKAAQGGKLPSLPCKVSKDDPEIAECRCYAENGISYIDIHAIRNTEAYIETIRICGQDGAGCRNLLTDALPGDVTTSTGASLGSLPVAPACSYLIAGSDGIAPMAPDAQVVSTFSLARAKRYASGQTSCTSTPAPYAGCMTASCTFENDKKGKRSGFATCRCPIYTGPFQVGQPNVSCDAGSGNVWSAGYAPPHTSGSSTSSN